MTQPLAQAFMNPPVAVQNIDTATENLLNIKSRSELFGKSNVTDVALDYMEELNESNLVSDNDNSDESFRLQPQGSLYPISAETNPSRRQFNSVRSDQDDSLNWVGKSDWIQVFSEVEVSNRMRSLGYPVVWRGLDMVPNSANQRRKMDIRWSFTNEKQVWRSLIVSEPVSIERCDDAERIELIAKASELYWKNKNLMHHLDTSEMLGFKSSETPGISYNPINNGYREWLFEPIQGRKQIERNLDKDEPVSDNASILKKFFTILGSAFTSQKKKELALFNAASKGMIQDVEKLISDGADPKTIFSLDGTTCLHAAADNGFVEVAEILLESGIDVNASDGKHHITPLHLAAQQNHLAVAKKLIFEGANVNAADNQGITPLYLASRNGNLELVEDLISKGAKVNMFAGPNGRCPLHAASKNGHLNVVNCLIDANAVVDNADKENGATPLHIATQSGHEEVVEALVVAGADIEKQDEFQGLTPLHIASLMGHNAIVSKLLSLGAIVECKENFQEYTPLHFAALNGHEGVVRTLISAGADIGIKSSEPVKTPIDVARMKGYEGIVKILESEEYSKMNENVVQNRETSLKKA